MKREGGLCDAQMSVFDYLEPDYNGSRDEIIRYSAENQLELKITLQKCCGITPVTKFRSYNEFWVICERCGKRTKTYNKCYKAMQMWNRGEVEI